MKKKYAIIGNPIKHSLSPTLHNYWFKKYNIDCEYEMVKIEASEIENVIDKIKSKRISGINVTLPFKQKIIPYLNKIVNCAKETNSVNTVYLDSENKVVGDNTDVFGFQAGYLKNISNNYGNENFATIGNKKIANIKHYGWMDFRKKKNLRLISKYDFLIHTSSYDANPSTVLEGISCFQ